MRLGRSQEWAKAWRERAANALPVQAATTDYWLSKLFYDLQGPLLAAEYRANPAAVLQRYPVDDTVRRALADDDVAALAPRVNAYLLRYYFAICGMPEATFVAKIRAAGGHG